MKTLITLLLALTFGYLNAQNTLSGKIIDNSNIPIEAAVISLLDGNSKAFKKLTVSETDGSFSLFIDTASYYIQVSQLGYRDTMSQLFNHSDYAETELIITLQNDAMKLDEVTITAKKPMVQVLADKTVFNINQSISSAGENGFELLRKAPGVIIDNSNSIIVEGKSGVLVYIDDKPSILRGEDLVNFLKTIQANSIEAIEIITQPSSKYDAEGNAGIINIIMKRDKSLGYKGSLGSGLNYGDFARFNNSFNLNYRSKKASIYGTLSNNIGKNTSFINLFRRQNGIQFNSKSNTISDFNNSNIRIGADYYASKKSTIGIVINTNLSDIDSETNSETPIIPFNNTQAEQILNSENNTESEITNFYANLNYRLKISPKSKLFVDLDYGSYESIRTSNQPNTYISAQSGEVINTNNNYMETPINIDLLTGKADLEFEVLAGKLSTGIKFSKVTTTNQFDFYNEINNDRILNAERSNNFEYDEQISAAYFNFNKKVDKWNIQAGLRLEHTESEGNLTSQIPSNNDNVKRSYTNLFPSGGISYQYTYSNSVSLNYSSRIRRPNYRDLNPFEYNIDELSFIRGNPFLQPQYTDNIKLSHTYNYKLNTSISYSVIEDFSAQVTEAVGANKNFMSPRNVANNKVINIGISYPTDITKWWSMFVSVNAFRSIFEPTNEDFLSVSRNTLSLFAQNTIKLPYGIRGEASGWYSSPSVWGGTYLSESMGSLNLAVQKSILDDKLSIKIGMNDVLFTTRWRGTTQFGDLFIDGSGGRDSRQITFNVSYNFGSSTVKSIRKRDTSIEDEKNRI